jgi:hypothetical protein
VVGCSPSNTCSAGYGAGSRRYKRSRRRR